MMSISSLEKHNIHLILIGCGSMGSALLTQWAQHDNAFSKISVITPRQESLPSEAMVQDWIEWHAPDTLIPNTLIPSNQSQKRIYVFAVKPKIMDKVLTTWTKHIQKEDCIISVAAGLELGFFQSYLSHEHAIVRIMPSTPSAIGRGISLRLANQAISPEMIKIVDDVFSLTGLVVPTATDDELDRLTAISGCGPAFVFSFTNAMKMAAIELGYPPEKADTLARAMVAGSADYMYHSSLSLETLIKNVASPGGMTAQGLEVLTTNNTLNNLMRKTTKATYNHTEILKNTR